MDLRARKRILVLTSTYPRHEGDTDPAFVKHLCDCLQESFEVHVLAPHAIGLNKHESVDGIVVHRFVYAPHRLESLAYDGGMLNRLAYQPWRYLLVPTFLASQWVNILKLCRREKIALIHAHWIVPQGLVAVLAASLVKVPVLVTSHGGDLYGLRGRRLDGIKSWILRRASHLTVVSDTMKGSAETLGMSKGSVSVSPMGVDLRRTFTPDPTVERGRRLLFVGRLVKKKGVAYLIQAMKRLVTEYPDLELDIVGDGPERGYLESLCQSENLEDCVRFHGSRSQSDLVVYYRTALAFVMPSVVEEGGDQEGLGLVAVEAMGCQCPVVASDLPAIRDVVRDGETGLITREKDPVDLARKIARLLDDDTYREQLGRKGREYVLSRFDWSIVGERYQRLIAQIIEREGRK